MRNAYTVLVGTFKIRSHLKDTLLGGEIILKCILKQWDDVGSIRLAWGGGVGTSGETSCEYGDRPSGYVTGGEFRGKLIGCWLLEFSARWDQLLASVIQVQWVPTSLSVYFCL